VPLMPPQFRNASTQFHAPSAPSMASGISGIAAPHTGETPISHMTGTNSSLGPGTSWQSKHLATDGKLPGLSRMNRGSTLSFDNEEPFHAPHSDQGARFIVGDRYE
jgi:hypothetical protein